MKIFLPFTDYFIYLCPSEIKNNTMMKYLQLILPLLLFAACQQGKSPDSSPATTAPVPSADTTASTPAVEETQLQATTDTLPAKAGVAGREVAATVQALTDGKLNFIVNTANRSEGKVIVTSEGVAEKAFTREFPVQGTLVSSFLLDLDKDGFSEVYVVLLPDDAGGHPVLKGYSSYRDKSAGEVYVKEPKTAAKAGSSRVFTENKALFRSFRDETGKEVTWQYELKRGETGFILTPEIK